MSEILANEFLADYNRKILPIFKSYFEVKKKELNGITELIDRLTKTAVLGKKIRGALVVLGYLLTTGKNLVSIYEVSLFIELMHLGFLIHDDIFDNSNKRRGLPSIHRQYHSSQLGVSMGINAGDLAFFLAWDKLMSSNFSKDNLIKAGQICGRYGLNTVYGQVLDVTNDFNKSFRQQDILEVFRLKTAEYTGVLPLLVGATLGGMNDKNKLAFLKDYGLSLGWAFQIQDDILGLYGSQGKTGKPVGTDLKEGKRTLLVHYLIKHGNKQQQDFLKKILGNKRLTQSDIRKAQIFFKNTGAYNYVLNLGWEYVKKGKQIIPHLTLDDKLKSLLGSFIELIMERTR